MNVQFTAEAEGVRLWTESFGDPSGPCILLIMAAYWQGIAWPDSFCRRLADAGYHVIRYDHRDTGESTLVDYEQNAYSLVDLADDAVRVLGAHGVERAHLLGGSMGGMIAQELALKHPDRVLSLISYASTPLSHSYAAGTAPAELPGPDEVAWGAFTTVAGPGVQPTREQYATGWTDFSRGVIGSATAFDEAATRELHERSFDRTTDASRVWNHMTATVGTPDRVDRLPGLVVPTLVVHGSEDHVVPVSHGHATAELIPHATLTVIDGLGHQFDAAGLDLIVEPVLAHCASVT
ncbi:MAG: alpha/beta hydrolase [Cryobacterium sp.]|nr:alpha/beta hydrolase [Cryobacterium sp.]